MSINNRHPLYQKQVPKFLQQYSHLLQSDHKKNYMNEVLGTISDEDIPEKSIDIKSPIIEEESIQIDDDEVPSIPDNPFKRKTKDIIDDIVVIDESKKSEQNDIETKILFKKRGNENKDSQNPPVKKSIPKISLLSFEED